MANNSAIAASAPSLFEAAVKEFQDELVNRDEFDFRGIETIDDVYKEISIIQEEQGRQGVLRHMKKIEPFLIVMEQYSGVVDTFVQAKANVLALIWVSRLDWALIGDLILKIYRDQ